MQYTFVLATVFWNMQGQISTWYEGWHCDSVASWISVGFQSIHNVRRSMVLNSLQVLPISSNMKPFLFCADSFAHLLIRNVL